MMLDKALPLWYNAIVTKTRGRISDRVRRSLAVFYSISNQINIHSGGIISSKKLWKKPRNKYIMGIMRQKRQNMLRGSQPREGKAMKNSEKTLDMIVNLCKSRGFVYAGSEIYGGLANS